MNSKRLPGKPLLKINKKPMLQRVYEQCMRTKACRIVITSDSMQIANLCKKIGCEFVETSASHENGTSRVEEAIKLLLLHPRDVVVNVQADEPFVNPENIDRLAGMLLTDQSPTYYQAGAIGIATLTFESFDDELIDDPNNVKVITDKNKEALYFSRSRIPAKKKGSPVRVPYQIHLGMYAYRVLYLHAYTSLPMTEIERIEGLEQLRAIYHGHGILVGEAINLAPVHGIDTPCDLLKAMDYARITESPEPVS